MAPCAICGAVHEGAQAGPGLLPAAAASLVPPACLRALVARVDELAGRLPAPGERYAVEVPVVPLGGSASGSGSMG
jgi:hypothetical protein